MTDYLFKALLTLAVFVQVVSGVGIMAVLVLIVLNGAGIVTTPV